MLKKLNQISNMILEYTQQQIDKLDANSGDIIQKREYIGFANTDCDIVKNILLGIMRFTVKEQNIFNESAIVELNSLYNTIAYGN